jgi:heat shock protein HslJ
MKRTSFTHILTSALVLGVGLLTACAPMQVPTTGGPGGQPAKPTATVVPPTEVPTEMPTTEAPMGKIPADIAPVDLMGTSWNLVGYGKPESLTKPAAAAILDISGEHFTGSTGCNHFDVVYVLENGELSFMEPGPIMTMMACPDPQMQQETDFMRILSKVKTYTREETKLTLEGSEGVLVFDMSSDLPLENTAWHLNGLAQNSGISSMLGDEKITLNLLDSKATGFGGCNNYFSDYKLNGNEIAFGPIGATKMFCDGDPGQREAVFLAALENVATYTIKRSTLTFFDGNGQMLMTFTVQTP